MFLSMNAQCAPSGCEPSGICRYADLKISILIYNLLAGSQPAVKSVKNCYNCPNALAHHLVVPFMRDCRTVLPLIFPNRNIFLHLTSWSTCSTILTGRYIFTAVIFEQYLDKCVLWVPVGVAQRGSEKTLDSTQCSTTTYLLKWMHQLSVWCKNGTQWTETLGCQGHHKHRFSWK